MDMVITMTARRRNAVWSDSEGTSVAKQKSPAPKRSAATEKAKASGTAFTIRGSSDWREWVERGAEHCRTDASKLFDVAVVAYLKTQGFNENPPKR